MPAIVLAAGAGRRFGGPKQLAEIDGRPLLRWVLDAARAVPALAPLIVVLGAHRAAIRSAIDLHDAEVVDAPDWAEGQAASLRAGVRALPAGTEAAMVLLGDTPFIGAPVISEALARFGDGVDVIRATYDGTPGHPVVLGARALARVPVLRGDVGARALLADLRVRTWEAAHLGRPVDIDTPQQLEVHR